MDASGRCHRGHLPCHPSTRPDWRTTANVASTSIDHSSPPNALLPPTPRSDRVSILSERAVKCIKRCPPCFNDATEFQQRCRAPRPTGIRGDLCRRATSGPLLHAVMKRRLNGPARRLEPSKPYSATLRFRLIDTPSHQSKARDGQRCCWPIPRGRALHRR
jgi:hypothetical protein